MPMCRNTEMAVQRAVARELDVHVLAANAGAGLASEMPDPRSFDGIDWPNPALVSMFELSAGWAAWYASGDELL